MKDTNKNDEEFTSNLLELFSCINNYSNKKNSIISEKDKKNLLSLLDYVNDNHSDLTCDNQQKSLTPPPSPPVTPSTPQSCNDHCNDHCDSNCNDHCNDNCNCNCDCDCNHKYNLIYPGGCIKNGEKVILWGKVLLKSSIYVESDGILEIKPGTKIFIENKCEPTIIVIHRDGIIHANGNKCEKIVFQSVQKNNCKGLWGGIIMLGYNCDYEYQCLNTLIFKCGKGKSEKKCCCKNSILNHVVIKNAGMNNYDSLTLSGLDENIIIDNITVKHSGNNAILMENLDININYLCINDIYKNGILIKSNVNFYNNYLYIANCCNFPLFIESKHCYAQNDLNFKNTYLDIFKSKGVTNITGNTLMNLNIKKIIEDSGCKIEKYITNDDFIEFIN